MSKQSNRLYRLQWVETITLPVNTSGFIQGLKELPTHLHDKLNPYLTINERQNILEKFGWIKRIKLTNGKTVCHMANPVLVNEVINDWVKDADYMKVIRDEMLLLHTGESYI